MIDYKGITIIIPIVLARVFGVPFHNALSYIEIKLLAGSTVCVSII